ncbi:MAG: dirigent protein [Thermomicrobiales bacterium]
MRTFFFGLFVVLFALTVMSAAPAVAREGTPAASPTAGLPAQADLPPFAGSSADGILTLVVIEAPVSDTVIDQVPEGDSLGDLLVFANAVYDETRETLVGTDQGMCVRSNPQAGVWECTWTLILNDGQIVVQGPFHDFAETSTFAITGGAGVYAGAEGEMTLSLTTEGEFMFTYRIIEE